MKKISVTGKTIEDAVQSGLAQLNTTEERVKVHIIEEPTKGFLGIIGSKEAKVELEYISDVIDEAFEFLKDIVDKMKLDVSVEIGQKKDNEKFLNLTGPEVGILIGRRGQTLDSLQYLVNIAANRYANSYQRVLLDAENFREKRKKTLEQLAGRIAARVIRYKREVSLEPMPPQDRKIIHTYLQDHSKLDTKSEGNEPNRYVVITLK
ncbi:RNA-binding cell elongation regulator Jag/EloR [Chengkuizengella axinellae]|uniref:RNA-binding protein KhpB n=1 Tax=Chengkuizengella axinellae TaxID=3064388 RepID=A0ABT9J3R3_9BACL|nr:RNA-binding cell elongation regulator Jag/EloR [Chengkuizengella sp. 2205SS18-9]MDP5276077.1 RNA-binding cell elongation regulator Jag/EloR [Chengkuizengella sp. 2205SS18-9]